MPLDPVILRHTLESAPERQYVDGQTETKPPHVRAFSFGKSTSGLTTSKVSVFRLGGRRVDSTKKKKNEFLVPSAFPFNDSTFPDVICSFVPYLITRRYNDSCLRFTFVCLSFSLYM
jgi:hypothetical protein